MCLVNPDTIVTRKSGIGYKSVEKKSNGEYVNYDFIGGAGKTKYPLNKWIEEPNPNERIDAWSAGKSYLKGFHICLDFHKMKDFEENHTNIVTIKVKFDTVVAQEIKYTTKHYGMVVVAQRIKNLGEV